MAAIAISSADPARRRDLAEQLGAIVQIRVVGAVADLTAALALIEQMQVDAVVADGPAFAQLEAWSTRSPAAALVALLDETDEDGGIAALHAGATAVLPRSAAGSAIAAAIEAAGRALATLPRSLIDALIDSRPGETGVPGDHGPALTPREVEVLAAMANGASNKAIARRLGISFHTAKFHVAAILAKLDADSRTEAVARAAHLGLVML